MIYVAEGGWVGGGSHHAVPVSNELDGLGVKRE